MGILIKLPKYIKNLHRNLGHPKRSFSHCEINALLNLTELLRTIVHDRSFYGRILKSPFQKYERNKMDGPTRRCLRDRSRIPLLADLKQMKQRWAILSIAPTNPKRPHQRSDQAILRLILILSQSGVRYHLRSVLLLLLGSHHTRSPIDTEGAKRKVKRITPRTNRLVGNCHPQNQQLSSI